MKYAKLRQDNIFAQFYTLRPLPFIEINKMLTFCWVFLPFHPRHHFIIFDNRYEKETICF
ncbi:MAG: hypothetical protein CMH48_00645 [Muricauda sp.]|nr:hypothetical protein [Allomuricauda sp.]